MVSIENPEHSWLWAILALLVNNESYTQWYFNLADVTLDACQHGSNFAKTTRLKGTPGVFDYLAGRCDGMCEHATWKVQKQGDRWSFNTAAEAQYPQLLAQRMVSAVAAHLPESLLQNARQMRLEIS
eukprot:s6236_g3.t1